MSEGGERFGAVILSAGFSSRMGDFKPLMDLGGTTVLERCVRLFRESGVHSVLVVTGHRAPEVQAEAGRLGVRTVHNPDYEEGMFSSVRTAVSRVPGHDAFFILPVDIPLIRPATVVRLLDAYDGRVAYPVFDGERGHPPLIPAGLVGAILEHDGRGGLQTVLEGAESLDVPVWDRGSLMDADTPDDFAALVRYASRMHIGERAEALALAGLSMPERGVSHGRSVASVAVCMGEELNAHGLGLDLDLLHNAAMLHDVAKGWPDHEKAGGELLASLGLHGLSGIVASHRDVPPPASGVLTEKEIVCLADKLVRCNRRVTVEDRFGEKLNLYRGDEIACAAIRGRLRNAQALQGMVEKTCGRKLDAILEGVLA
jgi:CTP:molybdopterin cytidylyltransferase MocA